MAVERKLEVGGDIRTGGGGVNGWDNGECCFLLCVYDEVISFQSTFLLLILHLRIGEACRRWSFLPKILVCSSYYHVHRLHLRYFPGQLCSADM